MSFFQYPDEDKGSKSESTRERKGDIGKERKRDEERQYNQWKNQIDSRDGEVKEREKERKEERTRKTKRKSEKEGERKREREKAEGCVRVGASTYWHQHQHAKIDRYI